jgi:hypothetical protein
MRSDHSIASRACFENAMQRSGLFALLRAPSHTAFRIIERMPAASSRLPPGPIVPGWTRLITALWPTRLAFDSLAYLLQNRAKFGRLFTITVGDQVTVVTSDPALMHEIFVTRASEFQTQRRAADDRRRPRGRLSLKTFSR